MNLFQDLFKGQQLEGMTTGHIMYPEQISPIILSRHVTTEAGTGVVHIAPGHGEDDFLLGKKYNLEIFSPVDEFGNTLIKFLSIKVLIFLMRIFD